MKCGSGVLVYQSVANLSKQSQLRKKPNTASQQMRQEHPQGRTAPRPARQNAIFGESFTSHQGQDTDGSTGTLHLSDSDAQHLSLSAVPAAVPLGLLSTARHPNRWRQASQRTTTATFAHVIKWAHALTHALQDVFPRTSLPQLTCFYEIGVVTFTQELSNFIPRSLHGLCWCTESASCWMEPVPRGWKETGSFTPSILVFVFIAFLTTVSDNCHTLLQRIFSTRAQCAHNDRQIPATGEQNRWNRSTERQYSRTAREIFRHVRYNFFMCCVRQTFSCARSTVIH